MFVYVIVNEVNYKIYIGKTKENNLQHYWSRQKTSVLKGSTGKPHLYNAVRKYGWDSFTIYPLITDCISDESLCIWEQVLIEVFSARVSEIGYNICKGGEGNSGPRTEETRRKTSIASKKMWQRPGHSENFVAKVTGKIRSPEALANYRNSDYITARRGSTLPEETRVKISESLTGLTRSVESRRKQGLSVSGEKNHFFGKNHSEETRKKMREASRHLSRENTSFYVHTHSEETRQKVQEIWTSERRAVWAERTRKQMTPERRAAQAERARKQLTSELCRKMIASRCPISEETKRRMRESQQLRRIAEKSESKDMMQ